jgi:hypothetical protein
LSRKILIIRILFEEGKLDVGYSMLDTGFGFWFLDAGFALFVQAQSSMLKAEIL